MNEIRLYSVPANPHPAGLIGETIANGLLSSGWIEDRNPPTLDSIWWVHPTGDRRWGSLEFAHKRMMAEKTVLWIICRWLIVVVTG